MQWGPLANQRRDLDNYIDDICKRKRPGQGVRTIRVGDVIVVSFPRCHQRRESLLDLLQGVQDRGL